MLARLTGMTQARLRELVRVAYVKVAEYQRRGLVHLHVVIRLDRAMPAYRAHEVHPPPPRFGVELLEDALRATVAEAGAPLPHELGGGRVHWGDELDIRQLGHRGHCLTKSRRYSTTFKALREAREQHVHQQLRARSTDPALLALVDTGERMASFRYVGQGHLTAADAFLAASAAARARENRRAAREALAIAAIDRDNTTREDQCRSTMAR